MPVFFGLRTLSVEKSFRRRGRRNAAAQTQLPEHTGYVIRAIMFSPSGLDGTIASEMVAAQDVTDLKPTTSYDDLAARVVFIR